MTIGAGIGARTTAGIGLVSAVVAAVLAGCAGPTTSTRGRVSLDQVAVDFRPLPGWTDDDHHLALASFQRSCAVIAKQANDKPLGNLGVAGKVGDWKPACAAARGLPLDDPEPARQFFEAYFRPVAMGGGGDGGLFTGYYEPELRGSWQKTGRYNVPLYKQPASQGGLPARSRIVAGALAGRGLELMWVDDAVDAFFLEVQGSGRVRMTDGSLVGLHYAGQNGHSYYPIGRHLIDEGIATREEMSLQYLRRYLAEHPGQANDLMNLNPSYVFFKVRPDVGARGAMNTELIAGRSLAVDTSYVPLGVPLWLNISGAPVPGGRIQRLVVAQDTGGAIKGQVRGDLFWGAGPEAAEGAGVMKAHGGYTMLVPRKAIITAQR